MSALEERTDANWECLLSRLPADWQEQARRTGAVRRLRGAASLGSLLRVLLLHVGHGCSLRTAAVAGQAAGWVSMSDVALHKRLVQSAGWLAESRWPMPAVAGALRLRLVDSTLGQEPGATGGQWRVLYSLSAPGWLRFPRFGGRAGRRAYRKKSLYAKNPSDLRRRFSPECRRSSPEQRTPPQAGGRRVGDVRQLASHLA